MREAVIAAAVRTAVGKAKKGALRQTRPEDMGAAVIRELFGRTPAVSPEEIGDVIIGCAMPEGEQGMNIARIIALYAGLPAAVPAYTVNRFCSSGLQTISLAAERIMLGAADIIIAGGVESMSRVPMMGHKVAPHPQIVDEQPETYMAMGHTAEMVAKRYGVSREDQDLFALSSHRKAAAAIRDSKFKEEIVPVQVVHKQFDEIAGRAAETSFLFDTDEGVRENASIDALSALNPAFAARGTVTAGNSSQMSDGAAAVLVMSREKAEELGIEPLAVYRAFAVGGVEPEVMGIGPVVAIPKVLRQAGVSKEQVKRFEINEAFASQCLQVIRQLELDEDKVNVNGGAIALGHPLGCTGAKLTVSLIHELRRTGGGTGVVSMCIGGGMGAAGVFEVPGR